MSAQTQPTRILPAPFSKTGSSDSYCNSQLASLPRILELSSIHSSCHSFTNHSKGTMKHLSALILLPLLNGVLAGGDGQPSDCVMTRVLPTVTVGCSETLPGATGALSPHATQPSGDQHYPPTAVEPEVHHPGSQSLAANPNQPTSAGSGQNSDHRPAVGGQSGNNATQASPGSSDAPAIVSGGSALIGHVSAEMIMASLLACLMPVLIGLI
ncbi:hypothetical protein FPCIR_2325 [Fusarium pseudocircinatum]|uniref:Uncharacterized protein n=1 Tax=Fusarium pseudocircinatum TaxID=56676 RepID=A0A8H5PQL8_9HYPO|nr:hypothetical protein FPCIR_2325 [Fusarium pseudocircinatum]